VHRVLARYRLARLSWLDRATGRVIRRRDIRRRDIRRYEHPAPGDLIHVDTKKLGRVPGGGGWRIVGRCAGGRNKRRDRVGYAYLHNAVDDHSRLAYSEIHDDERQDTTAAFWTRAHAYFTSCGITVTRVLTDNGNPYRSRLFTDALGATISHRRTRPYRPQTNGKVERFNRTLLDEWAYARLWRSETSRARTLDRWLHRYNHHRHHSAIGGPPASRVTNLPSYNN
jgi:transposase InsO family protein